MEPVVELSSGRIAVAVDAGAGGRLAQVWVDGTAILVGHDDVPDTLRLTDGSPRPIAWGAYPMVPWAGRIRNATFVFRGATYSLPVGDAPHAIHGIGYVTPWEVEAASDGHVRLGLELPTSDSWPFGGRVTQVVTVGDDHLDLRMEVVADSRAFPVSFGWHPWFRKPSRLDFHPARMYRRDEDGITVDELLEVPAGPWDDCFTNTLPVALTVDGVDLQLTSDCSYWVVFDELPHATCVEPQTGPPDAFTIAPRVLEPGESHAAWFRIAVGDQRSGPDGGVIRSAT